MKSLACHQLLSSFVVLAALHAAEPAKNLAALQARPSPDWLTRGVMYQIWLRAFTPEGTLSAAT
ncbi:MAG: hypothetical protein N2689_10895 [Verrucomicrobiae bacterium]|nr:hypothetical protein [Verrucomicrobiae bacterium]